VLTPEAASSSGRFISYGARRSLLLAGLSFSALLTIMAPITVNHGLHITFNQAWADSEGGDGGDGGGDGDGGDGGDGDGDHSDSDNGDHDDAGDDNGDNGDDEADDDNGDNGDDGDNNDDNQDDDTAEAEPDDIPPPP
jgi:hypothetical protein